MPRGLPRGVSLFGLMSESVFREGPAAGSEPTVPRAAHPSQRARQRAAESVFMRLCAHIFQDEVISPPKP